MRALEGICILDLTHMISGPYAALLLADLGAETIKIEPPGQGESTRQLLATDPYYSREGLGVYFLSVNRNKKSVTLDLKQPAGRALFYDLAQQADVVLDNFSPGVTQRLGIAPDQLAALNPRLITCSITGFGHTGPDYDQPAFDIVAQALSGAMAITGQPDGPPLRAGLPIADLSSGLMAATGILAALLARHQTGRGQHVDIAMLDTQISLLNYIATMYLLSGVEPAPLGNGHSVHVPYDAFYAQDGWMVVGVVVDAAWQRLMELVDAPDLDVAEYRTPAGRRHHQAFINRRLNEIFSTHPRAYWLERLRAARIPCAPVNTIGQALSEPHVQARGMAQPVPLPSGANFQMPGNPIRLSAQAADAPTPPPHVGQHTDEILSGRLGLTAAQLAQLRADGVI